MTSPSKHAAALSSPGRKHEDLSCRGISDRRRDGPAASEINMNDPTRVGDDWSLHVIVVKTPLVRIRVGYAGRRIGGLEKRSGAFPVTFDSCTATLPAPIPHRAVATPLGSVIRSELLPATVFASASSGFATGPDPRWHFQFIGAVLRALRTRISLGLLRFKPLQKSERVIANPTHFDPFCRLPGLAAPVGRTPTSQKETRKCPTTAWRNPT